MYIDGIEFKEINCVVDRHNKDEYYIEFTIDKKGYSLYLRREGVNFVIDDRLLLHKQRSSEKVNCPFCNPHDLPLESIICFEFPVELKRLMENIRELPTVRLKFLV